MMQSYISLSPNENVGMMHAPFWRANLVRPNRFRKNSTHSKTEQQTDKYSFSLKYNHTVLKVRILHLGDPMV